MVPPTPPLFSVFKNFSSLVFIFNKINNYYFNLTVTKMLTWLNGRHFYWTKNTQNDPFGICEKAKQSNSNFKNLGYNHKWRIYS
jgi:hypothetical protein